MSITFNNQQSKNNYTINQSGGECRSRGKQPKECSGSKAQRKKMYLKQSLDFHPDKNSDCLDEAELKFKTLQNFPSCTNPSK